MKFVNLTPHKINVFASDGVTPLIGIEPSGTVARVAVQRTIRKTIDDIPVYATVYGKADGVPLAPFGVMYIVSALVRQAMPERSDILSPGQLVRDNAGQPIGCIGLDSN